MRLGDDRTERQPGLGEHHRGREGGRYSGLARWFDACEGFHVGVRQGGRAGQRARHRQHRQHVVTARVDRHAVVSPDDVVDLVGEGRERWSHPLPAESADEATQTVAVREQQCVEGRRCSQSAVCRVPRVVECGQQSIQRAPRTSCRARRGVGMSRCGRRWTSMLPPRTRRSGLADVIRQRAQPGVLQAFAVQVVAVQSGEVSRRPLVQAREGRPALGQYATRPEFLHGFCILAGRFRRGANHTSEPGRRADVHGRRPVRRIERPTQRCCRPGEQPLHHCDGAQSFIVPQLQGAQAFPDSIPEAVLVLPRVSVLRANVPGQLLQVVHDRTLVARLIRWTVAPPALASRQQSSSVKGIPRGPGDLPESADLPLPDPVRSVSGVTGVGHEAGPDRVAHAPPGDIESVGASAGDRPHVPVHVGDEVVR